MRTRHSGTKANRNAFSTRDPGIDFGAEKTDRPWTQSNGSKFTALDPQIDRTPAETGARDDGWKPQYFVGHVVTFNLMVGHGRTLTTARGTRVS